MTHSVQDFDVIVVGGGHAGIEAAYAAARMGSKTLLLTLTVDRIGYMPCNPAIGGVGKGHIVYEISALGGLMPKLCTQTYLQARMLNTRKGPAVQGLRLQIDKHAYNELSKRFLHTVDTLTICEGKVSELIVDDTRVVRGVRTSDGQDFRASSIVLTTGTFLNGKVHIGKNNYAAGRQGEEAVHGLSDMLAQLGLKIGRLKTGTPPRLLRSSLDFSQMELQEADNLDYLFEFQPHKVTNTHPCYITHTNDKTHAIIKENLHLSAMYSGNISGIGPRYCPSIEDKIARFPDKNSHHVFVEPEGASTEEVYPNGISTSLPFDVQKQYIQSIKGFENAIITRPGYAVEYDFVIPSQLHHTLEVKTIHGLFLAGQLNGTTGYEEAAGQGIVAGINAHLKAHHNAPFILDRTESYIGIMIDDLVTMGVDEPYRMFTSRAERRLLLRQDNVFKRLTHKAHTLGLVDQEVYDAFKQEDELILNTLDALRSGNKNTDLLKMFGSDTCAVEKIKELTGAELPSRAATHIHAEILYGPYFSREEHAVEQSKQYKALEIPDDLSFDDMPGLSKELQQKLKRYQPANIAQTALIPGMTPAALSLIIAKVRNHRQKQREAQQ